jgi:hypothetical protein
LGKESKGPAESLVGFGQQVSPSCKILFLLVIWIVFIPFSELFTQKFRWLSMVIHPCSPSCSKGWGKWIDGASLGNRVRPHLKNKLGTSEP